ncbi:trypsin-like peptidase domain-containing protein [Pantanalinema rosaneae CENA516]|uniref:VMAP-C domain-containing protein n=1 Tax=Pantanalinema rosaneae TaxID=1620701 RepID=UPI003D6FF3FB
MFDEEQEAAYKASLVRFYQDNKVIGAGLYFSRGYILTCAHIVTQSLGLGKTPQEIATESVAGKPIKIDFPFIARQQFQNAEVVPEVWQFNHEDLAILKIVEIPDGAKPLSFPESTYYRDNRYHVCGFPNGHPDGIWSQGKFLGEQTKGRVQIEDTKTQGVPIEPGFSGAPVWDEQLAGIAGITVARDREREAAKVGLMIPYQRIKPVLEAIDLFELLLPAGENFAPHWRNAYQFVRPEISTEPYPSTLQDTILQVQNMTGQGSSYRAIERFIGYLAQPELGLSIQLSLLQWLHGQRIDALKLVQVVQQEVVDQQAKRTSAIAPHLIVWVKAELSSNSYSVQAYLIPNREQYDSSACIGVKKLMDLDSLAGEAQLEEFLQVCIDLSVEELPHEEDDFPSLQVEVFLPRQYLRWTVDRWHVQKKMPSNPKPKLISSRYSVILRCADRLDRRFCDVQMQRLWKKKWSTLNLIEEHPTLQRLACGNNKDGETLYDELDSEHILGWQQLQPPPSVLEDQACHFSVLLGTGTFVAVWLHQFSPNVEREFYQLLNNCLTELPTKVTHLRKEAHQRRDKNTPHIGEMIGFIWDDPIVVPPKATQPQRFRMPA